MIASMHAANAALPGPEREVLALLAESGLGYDGIAELLGVRRIDVAALAATARLRIAGAAAPPERCLPHLPHLAGVIDGERVPAADPAHVAACEHCAAALAAMRGADADYRNWQIGPMPEAVRSRLHGLSD
jgi:hypothetical protein